MMKLSRELAIFIAPNITRTSAMHRSLAPVNVVWGREQPDDRLRLVGHGDAHARRGPLPRGDMNAYLTYAAMVGAGLYGIEHKLPLEPEFKGTATSAGPSAHRRARSTRRSGSSSEARRPWRSFGQDIVDNYLNAARYEQQVYDSVVHNWNASATSSS